MHDPCALTYFWYIITAEFVKRAGITANAWASILVIYIYFLWA